MGLLKQSGYIVIFLLSLSVFELFGQSKVQAVDSIKTALETGALDVKQQLEAFNLLSSFSSSPTEKLNYGILLLELANKNDNEEYLVRGNFKIGVAYRYLGDLTNAQKYLFQSANDALRNEKLKSYLAEIYTEISTTYTQNGDSENALLYNSKAIDILRKTDRRQQLATSLLNTGFDYYVVGNYDSAMAYYNEAEPIFEEINLEIGSAYLIGNRALVYWNNGNLVRAKEDLLIAIDMLQPLGDQFGMADYYNQLANVFLEEEQLDSAIKYSSRSLIISTKRGFKEQARDAANLLFSIYQEESDLEKALYYQTLYYTYKDSIQNVETTQEIANLRTEFEVNRKQVELDALLEQKQRNQLIMIVGGIIFFVFASIVIFKGYGANAQGYGLKLNSRKKED